MTTADNTEMQFDHPMPEEATNTPRSGGQPSVDPELESVLAHLRERFTLGR